MKTTLAITIILLAAAASAAANEPTEADFEEFAETGVLDPDIGTFKAIELVQRGISSDQPRIVELTVRAMGRGAFELASYGEVVQRPFHLVPGLKEFLVAYWQDNAAELTTGSSRGARLVPLILAVHYPNDEDAYNVIMEARAFGSVDYWTLMALNAGRFKTPEADELRIASLSSEDYLTFASGALGIAMSKPSGGIEALVSALKSNPLSPRMLATESAILAYGPEAVPALREALEGGDLFPEAERVVSNGLRNVEDQLGSGREK